MGSLTHAITTKGIMKTAQKIGVTVKRCGITQKKESNNILAYLDLLERYDAPVTFPIPAVILDKYRPFFKSLKYQRLEFAIPGYSHIDYSRLDAKDQSEHLKKAVEIFKKFGIKTYGFRGPYLQANDDTLNVLKRNGLLYDSSFSVHWNVVPEEYHKRNAHSYDLALKLYEPKDAFLPYLRNGIIRIPVSLPDDEMLIDRFNIRNQQLLGHIWLKIMKKTIEKGGVFTLQLHPGRIPLALDALKMLIEEANKSNVWIASLKELAIEWLKYGKIPDNYKSVICITGDIDILSLWDYIGRDRRR